MKNWLMLLAAFVAALIIFGHCLGPDSALARPIQTAVIQVRVAVFHPFYEAAHALDETAGW